MTNDELNTQATQIVPFWINGEAYTLQDFLDGVDQVVERARETGEFEIVANTVRSMTSFNKTTGISLAKLLHQSLNLWKETRGDENEFFDYMLEFSGISRIVMERYILAWTAVLTSPEGVKEKLLTQPMKNLNELGAKISQGLEPDDETWDKIAETRGNAAFRQLISDNNPDDKPRKNRTTIYLERNGDLVAWTGAGVRISLGYLALQSVEELDTEDEINALQKCINRIVSGADIIRR